MTYRDDLEAARQRRDALASELRTVEKKMDELEALHERKRSLEQDLQKSAVMLDQARARVSLPMLSRVQVASPCHESWDSMQGDERARFCGKCEKNVFDLSAMTTEQAESLLRAHGASLCVRFYRRNDGTVLTSDCPVGQKRRRRRRRVAAAVLAGGMLAAGLAGIKATVGTTMGEAAFEMGKVEAVQGQTVMIEDVEDIEDPEVIEGPLQGEMVIDDVEDVEDVPEPPPQKLMGKPVFVPDNDPAGSDSNAL